MIFIYKCRNVCVFYIFLILFYSFPLILFTLELIANAIKIKLWLQFSCQVVSFLICAKPPNATSLLPSIFVIFVFDVLVSKLLSSQKKDFEIDFDFTNLYGTSQYWTVLSINNRVYWAAAIAAAAAAPWIIIQLIWTLAHGASLYVCLVLQWISKTEKKKSTEEKKKTGKTHQQLNHMILKKQKHVEN